MIILFSLVLALWFKYELRHFSDRINQQVYCDYHDLYPNSLELKSFLAHSKLQPKKPKWDNILLVLFPLLSLFGDDFFLLLIALILSYLALLDMRYQLTDIRYVGCIFLLSIFIAMDSPAEWVKEYLMNFLCTACFFCLFLPLTRFFLKKEGLGLGDALLFIALSPLFTFPEMFKLLFFSALFGLIVVLCCRYFTQKQIEKWPFIPFIYLAFWVVI